MSFTPRSRLLSLLSLSFGRSSWAAVFSGRFRRVRDARPVFATDSRCQIEKQRLLSLLLSRIPCPRELLDSPIVLVDVRHRAGDGLRRLRFRSRERWRRRRGG